MSENTSTGGAAERIRNLLSKKKGPKYSRYIDKNSIPGYKEKQEQLNKSNKIDDVKTALENDPNAPNWLKGGLYSEEDNPNGLAEKSEFVILFPEYREHFLKQNFNDISSLLTNSPYYLKVNLNCKEGKIFIETSEKTYDPFAILKGRDFLHLVARGVTIEQAKRVLEDTCFSEVIKIGNLCRNNDIFRKRRQRLLGPDGSTLKALELLTGTYIFIQGKTVSIIGDVKGIKTARRVIVDCMNNIHPIYHIKQLMVKRELSTNPSYKEVSWDKYLPKFQKNVHSVKKKTINKKEKKPYTPFPPAPEKSKKDLAIESGEYFLSETEKKQKKDQEIKEKQKENSNIKKQEKQKLYIPPSEDDDENKKKRKNMDDVDSEEIIKKISERKVTEPTQKKIKASDFIDN